MGLFDDDEELVPRKEVRLKSLPSIPETGWRPPTSFPNLSGAAFLGIDTETYDPELLTAGPGWARGPGKGEIVGVSIAAVDHVGNRGKWYFPIRHRVGSEDNLDPNNVLPWVNYALSNPYQPKVGANLIYDYGWLRQEGVNIKGELHDVQFAGALIDNNAFVGLDELAETYMDRHKTDDLAMQWVQQAYGKQGNGKDRWRHNIYRTPPRLIGPYAEDDADLTLRLLPIMGPLIDYEELNKPYRLECDLIPLMHAMRVAGVSVDVEGAHRMKAELEIELKAMYEQVWSEYGFDLVNADGRNSSHSTVIGRLLDHLSIPHPRTAAGNSSVAKEWLEGLKDVHPVGALLNDIREHEKMIGTFIQSYILDKNINGKLFPQFHQTKGDDGGTKVYRFASSDPNLQNIPSRTKLGKRVRRLFIPDRGHALWRKHDYSQIHYRLLAHFAVDKGDGSAEALREAYRNDPDMDYHFNVYQNVAPMIHWSTDYTVGPDGKLLPMDQQNEEIVDHRRIIKNVNFSGMYGVGEKTLIRRYLIGMDLKQAKDFLTGYHSGAPYVKATMEATANEVEHLGYVTTLLGRRIRFNLYEPIGYSDEFRPALPYDRAIREYGSFIRIAGLYKAINYRFQGSEPDIMKTGMLNLWNSGVFDFTGVPRVTVHDELGWSQIDESPATIEAFKFIQHTQENAIPLRVPVKVDAHAAKNWGDAK